jgi:hypothetical protein
MVIYKPPFEYELRKNANTTLNSKAFIHFSILTCKLDISTSYMKHLDHITIA